MELSVIIPAFNAARFLRRAIDSVLLQGDVVDEIWLVDNNSTDGTAAVCKAYQNRFARKIRVLSAKKQGASFARNLGLQAAGGTWIQFLDADDELLPGKIERQLALVSTEVDWVMGTGIRVSPKGEEELLQLASDPWQGIVYNGGVGDTNSNLFRRSTLLAIGGQREDLVNGMDMDMYARLLMSGAHWLHDPVPGSRYHDHSGFRLSIHEPIQVAKQRLELKIALIQFLRTYRSTYYIQHQRFFQACLFRGLRQLYTVDPKAADDYYFQLFPSGFSAQKLVKDLIPVYYPLYTLLGVPLVERMRRSGAKFKGYFQ